MKYTVPHYYRKFRCLAGVCPDTCCAGWEIAIDQASLNAYRKVEGPLGNRIFNSIHWDRGSFRQYEGRCAFLNEENLCDLQAEGGEKLLCKTCRRYPRHIEEFEGAREISLSLSCIQAARIVLGCKEPVRFLTEEREGKEEDFGDFDFFLYTKLTDGRQRILEILQNRELPLNLRMVMALSLSHDLQRRMDSGRLYEADGLLARYSRAGWEQRFKERIRGMGFGRFRRFAAMDKALEILASMEVLNPSWPSRFGKLCQALYQKSPTEYGKLRQVFLQEMEGREDLDWEILGEQLAVYFVFTYFCGAVYDGRAYTRMKFAIYGVLAVRELAFGQWICNKGELSFEEFADLAHCFSREVEHSDQNKQLLMDRLEDQWDYRMETLAGLIL